MLGNLSSMVLDFLSSPLCGTAPQLLTTQLAPENTVTRTQRQWVSKDSEENMISELQSRTSQQILLGQRDLLKF